MDFTIITPSMNYGRFLGECLQSVASQDGVTFEHLVMDGGSEDGSAEVVAGFPDAIWVSEKDGGMSEAINKGFDRARGDWVMWLNADDRLKPGALAAVAAFANGQQDADLLYGTFDFVKEDGTFIRRMRAFGWSPFVSIHHCCYVASTACFLRKTSVIDEGFRLKEAFHYVMDGELYARLHSAGKRFRYLPMALAEFRLHQGNQSMSLNAGKAPVDEALRAEYQHAESRAIRRAYGFTMFRDPYLNGMVDGFLWMAARIWRNIRKLAAGIPKS